MGPKGFLILKGFLYTGVSSTAPSIQTKVLHDVDYYLLVSVTILKHKATAPSIQTLVLHDVDYYLLVSVTIIKPKATPKSIQRTNLDQSIRFLSQNFH